MVSHYPEKKKRPAPMEDGESGRVVWHRVFSHRGAFEVGALFPAIDGRSLRND